MAKKLPYGATSSTCSLLQPGTFSQCDQIEQYLKGFCNKLFAFKNVQPLIKTKMLPELFDESLHWECKENAYFISPNKYLVYLNEVIRFKHINFKRTSKGLIITSIKMFLYDPPTLTLVALIGVFSAYGPSPQSTACRSPTYSLTTITSSNVSLDVSLFKQFKQFELGLSK